MAHQFFRINSLLWLILFSLCISSTSQGQTDWRPSNYEARFDHPKNGVHLQDNNVWVYTLGFAKRFGMPAQWVDDSLQGAEAVAYRVEQSNIQSCGFFGESSNCRHDESCVFDLYLREEDSKKLPWKTSKPIDYAKKETSIIFLTPQSRMDQIGWDQEKQTYNLSRLNIGLDSVNYVLGPINKENMFAYHGPMRVVHYDREFYSDLDYIQLSSDCTVASRNENVRIWFTHPLPSKQDYFIAGKGYDEEAYGAAVKARYAPMKRGEVPHEVALPDAYMLRVNAYDAKEFQPKSLGAEVERRLSKPKIKSEKESWWKRLFED